MRGILTGSNHRFIHRNAAGIGQCSGPVRIDGTGEKARAEARHPEPGSFLFAEGHNRNRTLRPKPLLIEKIEGGKRRRHSQRPVEGAAIGYRVEMTAHCNDLACSGIALEGPQVGVSILLNAQLSSVGLLDEPPPELGIDRGPRESPVPGLICATDWCQLGQQFVDAHAGRLEAFYATAPHIGSMR